MLVLIRHRGSSAERLATLLVRTSLAVVGVGQSPRAMWADTTCHPKRATSLTLGQCRSSSYPFCQVWRGDPATCRGLRLIFLQPILSWLGRVVAVIVGVVGVNPDLCIIWVVEDDRFAADLASWPLALYCHSAEKELLEHGWERVVVTSTKNRTAAQTSSE